MHLSLRFLSIFGKLRWPLPSRSQEPLSEDQRGNRVSWSVINSVASQQLIIDFLLDKDPLNIDVA